MTLQETVSGLLMAHEAVSAVVLRGSQASGGATPLSDWDFRVATSDFDQLSSDIASLVKPMYPMASFWEPYSREATYMLVVDGPEKIDLVFSGVTPERSPRGERPSNSEHFWTWVLWLGGKTLRSQYHLVARQLKTMHGYLLAPLGVIDAPGSIDDAVSVFRRATGDESEMGAQVESALRRNGVIR